MPDRYQAGDLSRLERVVRDTAEEVSKTEDWGKAADYIPELAHVDTRQFGMAVLTRDGEIVTGGDAETRFTIQSISKVFSLTIALETFGEKVWERMDREPSGDPYNSIVELERHGGLPRNPFINSGALVIVDMLLDLHDANDTPDFVRDFIAAEIGKGPVAIDDSVWQSEESSSFNNRALANLAKAFGNLNHTVDDVMRTYVRQCAVLLSCRELAQAGRYLMLEQLDGDGPENIEQARRARRVASLMLTCGQYDGSGDFAFRVGLPGKSGVGGGIIAIVPNIASVAVWAPGLDERGNSLVGTRALQRLSDLMDWTVFGSIRKAPHS